MRLLPRRDLVAIQAATKEEEGITVNILVASAYFPGVSNIISTLESELLIDYCEKERAPISNDIHVANVGCTRTFVIRNWKEVLDITIENIWSESMISQWMVRNPRKTDWIPYKVLLDLNINSSTQTNKEPVLKGRAEH
ncbi:unnamed protein product [Ceratitis capitata]|uniref:(Mediterranean fruit fly) hypothetical protein n=1 Tax=Ceratitis capitata TaxID=7213 RepID=A0A811UQA0_CERCA|nr:unnamed protein product [Ceratitis capitata]